MNLFKSLGIIALAAAIICLFVGVWTLLFGFGGRAPGWSISFWLVIGAALFGVSLFFFLLGATLDKFSEWRMKRGIRQRRENVGRFTQYD